VSTELSDLLGQYPSLADAYVLLVEAEGNPMLEALQTIHEEMAQAKAHLAEVRSTIEAVEEAGVCLAVPSEQWQRRKGGPKRYLYMLFGTNRHTGRYEGPHGRRKLYVGCRAENIAEARRLAENRRRWEELERTAKVLDGWISTMECKVQSLAQRAVEGNPAVVGGRSAAATDDPPIDGHIPLCQHAARCQQAAEECRCQDDQFLSIHLGLPYSLR
jgi:hypothetical protein